MDLDKILKENKNIRISSENNWKIKKKKRNKKQIKENDNEIIRSNKKCLKCNKSFHNVNSWDCEEEIVAQCEKCLNLNHKAEDCLIYPEEKIYYKNDKKINNTLVCLLCNKTGHYICPIGVQKNFDISDFNDVDFSDVSESEREILSDEKEEKILNSTTENKINNSCLIKKSN